MIECKHVSFSYQEETTLEGIDVTISDGQCIMLCGKSGCGKTTFTRLLNGLIPKFYTGRFSGQVLVYGLESEKNAIEDYVQLVGSVFQNPKTQYFNTDTTSELAFPCENVGMPSKEIRQRIDAKSEEFQITHLLDRNILHLSGGQKQSIAFVCANMLHPKLLVLDEPTSNLDHASMQRLHDLIQQIKKKGVTVVIAEHRLAWAKDLVDRYLYFDQGKIVHTWTSNEIERLSPQEWTALGLRALDLETYRKKVKEKRMEPKKEPLLSVQDLMIGYDKKKPVHRVDHFTLCRNEVVCLMGENGTGKTTLIKTLCGLMEPLSGKILFQGKAMKKKQLLKHCFVVMQDVNYQLFSESVKEEIRLGAEDDSDYEEILSALDLADLEDRHPMSLSGGQKQRVAIACALMSKKDILIMDEPTSGLDLEHMMQFARLVRDLKEKGKCILIVTHDEELVAYGADRVIELKKENKNDI